MPVRIAEVGEIFNRVAHLLEIEGLPSLSSSKYCIASPKLLGFSHIFSISSGVE